MNNRPSLVIVLAEDARHQRFVRLYLYRLGHKPHDIRFEPLPSGRGCGEQWVRERYARSVKAYRARSARAGTALIVAIDADNMDLTERRRQLRDALEQARMLDRSDNEKIAHLIPKRNVETWILCLSGTNVDETADYKGQADIDDLIKPAAMVFHDWSRVDVTPPSHCVASLFAAIPEIRRLD